MTQPPTKTGRDFIGNVVPLWTCPACGFTFDAGHTDMAVDGMTHTDAHSCPQCAEARLRAALERIAESKGTGLDQRIAREALDG